MSGPHPIGTAEPPPPGPTEPDHPPRIPVDRHALYAAFGRRERWTFPADCGVIAAADPGAFDGLKLMLASLLLSHDAKVTIFDLGMTRPQRAWLARQPVAIVEPDLPDGHRFEDEYNRWTLWIKPFLLDQSPYPISIWLDSDLIVRRDLSELAEMARGRGVAIFPDTFARPHILSNNPGLYAAHPVDTIWPSVNSGVIGFRRGHPFIAESLKILRAVIAHPPNKDLVACWDQGCIKWGLESTGDGPIADPSWNRPGWSTGEIGSGLTPDEVIARSTPGEIAHFQSSPKPWARWADYPLSLREAPGLSVAILGHEPFARPARTWLRDVDLTTIDPDPAWGENRAFLMPVPETGYVGLSTFSWVRKYDAGGTLAPWEFGELELRPDVVWCAARTDRSTWLPYPDWEDHSEHFNPGIKSLIEELRGVSGRTETAPTLWSNNFVCRRDVFVDMKEFHEKMRAYFTSRYPGGCPYRAADPSRAWAYLGEAFTAHYFASRPDLNIVEMRRGARLPSLHPVDSGRMSVAEHRRREKLVKACEFRGCRTGCQKAMCHRDHVQVYLSTCIECVGAVAS